MSIDQSAAAGTSNLLQIAVAGSENVNIIINGQLAVELVAPVFPRPLPCENPTELDLLKAAHAQIPFAGREAILEDFISWCLHTRSLSMRILIGRGGAGKTRFAYELYARMRQEKNWGAWFVQFRRNEARGVNLWKVIKSEHALLVVDYASDSAKPLGDLLRTLEDSAEERRLRILLLARTADWEYGWLASLASGRTGGEVDRRFHPREPVALPEFTAADRHAVFERTVQRAAEFLGVSTPQWPDPHGAASAAEKDGDALTLMMAALIAVHEGVRTLAPLSRTELALKVADRLASGRMRDAVDDHRELFLHMAAYVTLCGGMIWQDALAVLGQESGATALGSVTDPEAFLAKLQAWLPGKGPGRGIGPIEPDLIGEAYILGRSSGQ